MSQAGWKLGDEFSDYKYVTEAETFLEGQYTKFGAGDKLSVLNIIALVSLAL